MGAMVRCPVRWCQAWVPLNGEEERQVETLPDDEAKADVLCIACGLHSDYTRRDLIAAQVEEFYSTRTHPRGFDVVPVVGSA